MGSERRAIIGFVMCGGIGTRLWPLSRQDNPKQFHALTGRDTMVEETIARLAMRPDGKGGETPVSVCVLAAREHREAIGRVVDPFTLNGGRLVFEPMGRNTAAAVATATAMTLAEHGNALMLVAPADHAIGTHRQFWQSVEDGIPAADDGSLVIFGIRPDRPETGYGYIEASPNGAPIAPVERFVEKPDFATAQAYVKAGTFFWNSGLFLFRAETMRRAFRDHAPDIYDAAEAALAAARTTTHAIHLPAAEYGRIRATSLDYAVMEHARDIKMVPARFSWSDIGSWQALHALGPFDDTGTVTVGDVVAIDCRNSFIRSDGPLVAAYGLRDTALVATRDAVFAIPLSQSQHVREVLEALNAATRTETRRTPPPADALPRKGGHADRAERWLADLAYPLWSDIAADRAHGGFHEVVDFDGRSTGADKRTRTMARQVFAFSRAVFNGWGDGAADLVDHGVGFIDTACRLKNGGFARTLDARGKVIDPTVDTYDLAFILFAMAHAHRAGHPDAARIASDIAALLDGPLRHPKGGFLEALPARLPRRQNPHMHLLEAFLAWHAATGETSWLECAEAIVALFETRFFNGTTGFLGEYFTDRLDPADPQDAPAVEPGHMFEWVHLLDAHARATGAPARPLMRTCFASAKAFGVNPLTGTPYDGISLEGAPVRDTSRAWVATEALRGHLAMEAQGFALDAATETLAAALFARHLDPAPPGLWNDAIAPSGAPLSKTVPASTFYHLVGALEDYLAACRDDKFTTASLDSRPNPGKPTAFDGA